MYAWKYHFDMLSINVLAETSWTLCIAVHYNDVFSLLAGTCPMCMVWLLGCPGPLPHTFDSPHGDSEADTLNDRQSQGPCHVAGLQGAMNAVLVLLYSSPSLLLL